MNWVDLTVIAVMAVSGLLAMIRGLVRELLGIGAWVGAGYCAVKAYPYVEPRVLAWIDNPDLAIPVAYGVVFVGALVVFSIAANVVADFARGPGLGGINRTLGMVFGLGRGAVLVVLAYIIGGIAVDIGSWPDPVLEARTLPLAYEGAVWAVGLMPEKYRPKLYPPPAGRDTRAAELPRATPELRAIDRN